MGKKIALSLGVIVSILLIPIVAQDAFAGANGVPDPVQLGDFKCYTFDVSPTRDNYPLTVTLDDEQFGESGDYPVGVSRLWCNPALKMDQSTWPSPSPEPDVEQHYKVYEVCDDPDQGQNCDPIDTLIVIHDQFGNHPTTVLEPVDLWVPASKTSTSVPSGISEDPDTHYLCYDIEPYSINQGGLVMDQFFTAPNQDDLFMAFQFCTPVDKTFNGQKSFHNNPQDLVCYFIADRDAANVGFVSDDQLDQYQIDDGIESSLCVVATKSFPVGGTVLLPDSVSLLVLEAQSSAIWWLPAVVIAGAGLALFKIKKKN